MRFPTSGCGSNPSRSRKVDNSVRKLVEEMFEAMYAAPGIGLAAIQLGDAKRVITMDLAKKDDPQKSRRSSSIRKSSGRPRK